MPSNGSPGIDPADLAATLRVLAGMSGLAAADHRLEFGCVIPLGRPGTDIVKPMNRVAFVPGSFVSPYVSPALAGFLQSADWR